MPFLLLVPFLAMACGDRSMGEASEAGAPALVPEAEEVYRIGSLTGGDWDSFSRLVDARFDAEGNLYLLDSDTRTVTVVDGDGQFLRTIGGPGDGPGEFRMPVAMAVLPDGHVAVSDGGHRGLLLFDEAGTFVRSIPLEEGEASPSILFAHGDDGLVLAPRGLRITMRGGGAPEMPSDAPIRRVSVDDEAASELVHRAWIPPRELPRASGGAGGAMRMVMPIRAFEPSLHVAVLPDGTVAVADSSAYRIHLVRPGRGVEETLERTVSPVTVTDREQELERARRLAELRDGGGPSIQATRMGPGGASQSMDQSDLRPMLEEQIENHLVFWPEIPVIERLAVDGEGRIWVRRFAGVGEPGSIEILDREGTLLATVPAGELEFPSAFGPDGLAAWIERDEYDVPFVRVARLTDLP